MTSRKSVVGIRRLLQVVALSTLFVSVPTYQADAQGPGGPNGVDILIRAENRVTTDTPFCGIGGGSVGDRLSVDAFMDTAGVVSGMARFETAAGQVTNIDLNRMFAFSVCSPSNCGGLLVQNQANQNTVPIWVNDFFVNIGSGLSPALVNVELPRGCSNTKSTFTPGLDKVTVQIRFR